MGNSTLYIRKLLWYILLSHTLKIPSMNHFLFINNNNIYFYCHCHCLSHITYPFLHVIAFLLFSTQCFARFHMLLVSFSSKLFHLKWIKRYELRYFDKKLQPKKFKIVLISSNIFMDVFWFWFYSISVIFSCSK